MALPKVVYVYEDGKGVEACLIASKEPDEKEGLVGVYDLRERLQVRWKTQLRREKTRRWFDK